ncbi:hypothetical protein EVAR_81488_1 [Eumeta japonica]|uniref:Uncharacterized protein n=1 Tax=Eumeta variegata TaxID=151549 RepID=A0A4C1W1L2_EUMVA|nr:hypothetical protein EVAR_81488_1 [Eumeta japonica]
MDTHKPKGVTNALPLFWVRIGYVMEDGLIEGKWGDGGGLGPRKFHSLDETKQRNLLLHIYILSRLRTPENDAAVSLVIWWKSSMVNRLDLKLFVQVVLKMDRVLLYQRTMQTERRKHEDFLLQLNSLTVYIEDLKNLHTDYFEDGLFPRELKVFNGDLKLRIHTVLGKDRVFVHNRTMRLLGFPCSKETNGDLEFFI